MSRKTSLEEFIARAGKKHNYKYNYSKTKDFKNQNDKVITTDLKGMPVDYDEIRKVTKKKIYM